MSLPSYQGLPCSGSFGLPGWTTIHVDQNCERRWFVAKRMVGRRPFLFVVWVELRPRGDLSVALVFCRSQEQIHLVRNYYIEGTTGNAMIKQLPRRDRNWARYDHHALRSTSNMKADEEVLQLILKQAVARADDSDALIQDLCPRELGN